MINNTKFIIFISIILTMTNINAKVSNQTNPQSCSKQQRETYLNFYKQKFIDYDLFLADQDFKNSDCYYQVFLVDGLNKTVLWIDMTKYQISNYSNLYISRSNASTPFAFEDNLEIPLLSGSLNESLIKEKNGQLNRADRVSAFLTPFVNSVLKDFDVNKKQKYFEMLYLMNRINLDKLMNIMFTDFFSIFLAKQLPFLYENWEQDLINQADSMYQVIMQKLHGEFQNKLDEKIASQTYQLILKNEEFTSQSFALILEILGTFNEGQNPTYGRNSIGAFLNSKYNLLNLQDLQNFMNDYLITIDKKKSVDFNYKVEGQSDPEKFNNLLNIMKNIPIYQIRFFLFEKFELISLKRNQRNGYSFNLMSRTPADNCGFTSNKKLELLNLILDEKVLDESTFKNDLVSTYVRCEKTVVGNVENFRMILKPDQDQECEVVVEQTDQGSNQYTVKVLLDTNMYYKGLVSCMRYTRGLLENNFILI